MNCHSERSEESLFGGDVARRERPRRDAFRNDSRNGIFGLLLILSVFGSFWIAVAAQGQKKPPAKPIDLNAATIKELQELPGVGPVTAQRILDARQKSGRFRRVEDLLAIRGISTKRLEALRPYVTISPPPPSPAKKP
jgi:competence ComEA-like helix-hairpin-helix protein